MSLETPAGAEEVKGPFRQAFCQAKKGSAATRKGNEKQRQYRHSVANLRELSLAHKHPERSLHPGHCTSALGNQDLEMTSNSSFI